MDSSLIEGLEGDKQSPRTCLWHREQSFGHEIGNLTCSVCTKGCPLPFDLTSISTLKCDEAFCWQQNFLLLLQLEWNEVYFHCIHYWHERAHSDFFLLVLPKWRQNSGWATKSLKVFHDFQRLIWPGWFSTGRFILFLLVKSYYWPKKLGIWPTILFFHEVSLG